ncbi:MAG TPA: tRNA (adenosine(37)-N6)-threonylcarbamoyltransferase complex dimerization subunit type 1 TsaB [Bacteroidota bacterium]|nr:tRNA (adenosine(37)-N6)-threonylcarbamoyltransferase complex dimerization subunit type 1 TsaB [Bacteroidota bacterium]
MTVLGIETATAVCAAALVRDGRVEAESLLDAGRVHAERLLGQIVEVLGTGGVGALEGVAVSIGPGSFTGLRIGVSVAKGLAVARDIPIAAVPTLEALALHATATDALPAGARLVAALDARRSEVYCQRFDVTAAGAVPADEPRDVALEVLLAELGGAPAFVTGDGAAKVLSGPGGPGGLRMVSERARLCSAAAVARIGERLLAAGSAEDPALLEPRYIKEFFLTTR